MNTATKLLELINDAIKLSSDGVTFGSPADVADWMKDSLAALAPPSGEGVDAFSVMRSAFVTSESCGPEGDYRLVFRFRSLEALQQAHCEWVTTPQSAPVDGEFVLVPREPTPQMIDATWDHKIDGIESQNTRNRRIYTAMIAAAPTPPPASQERGGGYYKTASGLWRMRAPTASPPSSAAEASINSPEIDSKLIPDAAERAKPAGDDAIREQYRDGTFTRYFGAHPSEQAQAGELPFVREALSRLAEKVAYLDGGEVTITKADACAIGQELLRRLADGVTDAMVERALHASVPGGSKVWCWLPQLDAWKPATIAYEIMRAALVDALGAK